MVFDGGDDGDIVSAPFALLHPHFGPQSWAGSAHKEDIIPLTRAAHTYRGRAGGSVFDFRLHHCMCRARVRVRGA